MQSQLSHFVCYTRTTSSVGRRPVSSSVARIAFHFERKSNQQNNKYVLSFQLHSTLHTPPSVDRNNNEWNVLYQNIRCLLPSILSLLFMCGLWCSTIVSVVAEYWVRFNWIWYFLQRNTFGITSRPTEFHFDSRPGKIGLIFITSKVNTKQRRQFVTNRNGIMTFDKYLMLFRSIGLLQLIAISCRRPIIFDSHRLDIYWNFRD